MIKSETKKNTYDILHLPFDQMVIDHRVLYVKSNFVDPCLQSVHELQQSTKHWRTKDQHLALPKFKGK